MSCARRGDARLPASFWAKVEASPAGCWLWTAARDTNGYGMIRQDGRLRLAHRVACAELVGPIPHGLQLDHLCRVRHCVNPEHLEPVTARENQMRSDSPAARNAAKTHCPAGHELSGENLLPDFLRKGQRKCRICKNARRRVAA